jgi:hypothetical protein
LKASSKTTMQLPYLQGLRHVTRELLPVRLTLPGVCNRAGVDVGRFRLAHGPHGDAERVVLVLGAIAATAERRADLEVQDEWLTGDVYAVGLFVALDDLPPPQLLLLFLLLQRLELVEVGRRSLGHLADAADGDGLLRRVKNAAVAIPVVA